MFTIGEISHAFSTIFARPAFMEKYAPMLLATSSTREYAVRSSAALAENSSFASHGVSAL